MPEKKRDFTKSEYSLRAGFTTITFGIILYSIGSQYEAQLNRNDDLSVIPLAAVIFWAGGILLLCDPRAIRAEAFPLIFLLFLVPVPGFIIKDLR